MRRYWGERISAVVLILLSFYVGQMALEFPAGGGTFPLFSVGATVVMALLIILDTYLGRDPTLNQRIKFDFSYTAFKPTILTAVTIIYVLAIFELGYFVSSAIFLVVSTMLVGIRNYVTILITAVILFPLMYAFFELFLQANLPQGLLI
jgi:putative tricarboxylic transport membrane protein